MNRFIALQTRSRYLFGGDGYGPDTDQNAVLQKFEVNYNPQVAPRDKRNLEDLRDSDFVDLNEFVTKECTKYQFRLQSKFLSKSFCHFILFGL